MAAVEAEAEWEPAGLLPAAGGGLDWGERGGGGRPGEGAGGRAGAEAAVSPAEAVLGEELGELLGAAESRRDSRDEPEVRERRVGRGRRRGREAGGRSPQRPARPAERPPAAALWVWRRPAGLRPAGHPALAAGARSARSPGKLPGSKSRV